MKVHRRYFFSALLALLLCVTMALPVSAAKPQKNTCGLLAITTSGEDMQFHMAVCVEEEDGNYVYCGTHPIQQQIGLYVTVTNALDANNYYTLEEDLEYDGPAGIYRFALGDKAIIGTEPDLFPKMAAVRKDETVYFVHADLDESDIFVMEKTTVASVSNGVLTTRDQLEKDSGNGDFSVIFNDSGNVVGFCKSGVASAPASGNTGPSTQVILIAAAVLVAAVVLAAVLFLRKKPNGNGDNVISVNPGPEDISDTVLDDGTEDFSGGSTLLSGQKTAISLVCHGGYQNGRIYPVGENGVTIGRGPDNNICYPKETPGISRKHARVFWLNGQLVLLDLNSSNGTYLRSGRIPPMQPVPVNPGDVFYLGEKVNGFEIAARQR